MNIVHLPPYLLFTAIFPVQRSCRSFIKLSPKYIIIVLLQKVLFKLFNVNIRKIVNIDVVYFYDIH